MWRDSWCCSFLARHNSIREISFSPQYVCEKRSIAFREGWTASNKPSNHRWPKPGICTIRINCPFMTRCEKKTSKEKSVLRTDNDRDYILASAQRIATMWSNISKTTRTVSSNIQTPRSEYTDLLLYSIEWPFLCQRRQSRHKMAITYVVKTAKKTDAFNA